MIIVMCPSPTRWIEPGTPDYPCVSGMATLDLLRTLAEVVTPETYKTALAQLPSDVAAELEALTAVSWWPLTSLGTVLDTVAQVAGLEPEAMVDETVRRSIDHTFKTVWRLLLRVTSVEAMVKRTPVIYARSRNVGQLQAHVLSPGHAEITLMGWPDVSERQMRVLSISIQRIVEISGRKDVAMIYARAPEGARFQLRWRE